MLQTRYLTITSPNSSICSIGHWESDCSDFSFFEPTGQIAAGPRNLSLFHRTSNTHRSRTRSDTHHTQIPRWKYQKQRFNNTRLKIWILNYHDFQSHICLQTQVLTKSRITLNPNRISHNAPDSRRPIPNFRFPKIKGILPQINITKLISQIPTANLPHSLLSHLTTLKSSKSFHHLPNLTSNFVSRT